jgi:hypothetical protein
MRRLLASNAFRVGIVALSAAIIFGAWAFAEYGGDETPSDGDSAIVLSLDDEYEQARRAAEAGDTDEAIVILERILAEDPDNERAAALLRQLRNAQTADGDDEDAAEPASPGGEPGDDPAQPGDDSGTPPDDPGTPQDTISYLDPVGDLDSLLPQVISGWQRGSTEVVASDATVPFGPTTSGDISRALYSVHDRESVEGALEFIEMTSKVAYRQDGAQVRVGTVDGYFGTDGSRLATVAFARGRFAFEVVVTVPDGDPASQTDAAIALAREFEAAK